LLSSPIRGYLPNAALFPSICLSNWKIAYADTAED
jgi:hypothetical protein